MMELSEITVFISGICIATGIVLTLINLNLTLAAIREAAKTYTIYTEAQYCDCEKED